MKFTETYLKGSFIIEPTVFQDERGLFERLFCENEIKNINHYKKLVQINYSFTKKAGVIRGMHYQNPPKAEAKIVRCLRGSVYDVIIDLRKGSDTIFNWKGQTLSSDNKSMIYIPEGFAHGFQTLEEDCELLYFHTEFYSPEYQDAILYNDPKIGIKWPIAVSEISEKDKSHSRIAKSYKGIVS
jgi:dTDP-4-dehydrorhamnose 3,5-epimerase